MKLSSIEILKKLRIIISIVLIILVVFSIGFTFVTYQNTEDTIKTTVTNHSLSVSREVLSFFSYYMGETAILAQDELLINYINALETRDDKVTHPLYSQTIEYLSLIKNSDPNHAYAWLSLFNINDFLTDRIGAKLPDDYDITSRPWYPELLNSQSPITVTSPYNDIFFDDTIVSVIAPVWTNEQLVGTIGVDIMIESIETFIGNYTFGDSGHAILIAPSGEIISSITEIDGQNINDANSFLFPVKENIILDQEHILTINLQEKEYIFSHNKISNLAWTSAVLIEKDELYANSNTMMTLSIFLIFFTLAIVILFSFLLKLTSDNDILKASNEALKNKERIISQQNEEMNAAYQQLSAAEEELKAQYDELSQAYLKTSELQNRLETAVEYTHAIVWEYYPAQDNLNIVAGFTNLDYFPYQEKQSFKDNMKRLIMPKDYKDLQEKFETLIDGRSENIEHPFRNRNSRNEWVWSLFKGTRIIDDQGNFLKILGYVININDVKTKDEKLKVQAYIDPLTQLPNRRKFVEILSEELQSGSTGAVIMLDLDNFKQINDTKGHVYGDEILKEISKRLEKTLDSDFLSRFGGDEFLVLLKGTLDRPTINSKIRKIINTIKECLIINDEKNYISASVGISLYPETGHGVNELIMQADLAMYEVKNSGKNRYIYYHEGMNTESKKRLAIENALQDALDNNAFELLYQPQYHHETLEIIGVEALLRLGSRQFHPGEFIPVAEDTGLIIEIGRWVTQMAIAQWREWYNLGIKDIKMSINFSAVQIHDLGYIDYLKEQIDYYQMDPSKMDIEITESIFLDDKKESIKLLKALKDIGVSISLDDFGTGYSSLSYLLFLPVDTIKLDKTMIDAFENIKTRKVIENMIHLAHDIDLKVVAEGVETKEQLTLLDTYECDYIQGFYLSKPITADEIIKKNESH